MLSVKSDLPAVWNLISPPCPSLLIAFWGAGQSYSYREYSLRFDETTCLKSFPVPSLTLGDELTYLRVTKHFFPDEEIFQTFKIILGRNPSPNQKQAGSFSTDLFPVQMEFDIDIDMFIQKDMASRNVLSVLLRVCDKAAGII